MLGYRQNKKRKKDKVMENIFEGTPFKSYEDLIETIDVKKAKFSFSRSAAYNVATQINTISFFTYYLGLVLSIIIIIAFSVSTKNYWILFSIPILFVINLFIHRLKVIVILCIIGSIIAILFQIQLWILSLLISIIVLFIGYQIWWGITTFIVQNELIKNEQLFISMWKGKVMAIKDNNGSFYVCKAERM